ncbi:hypothetical protein ASPCADRAFT_401265 [Aspergillus carbonarius ITEM 5010]|uniref:Uncharacterized protein n=1 Tax=Aspergillus carbonarius (strain ITEM 5010) TaxID=602072 RepID=A0A1R3R5L9_ASPC5|nr:hypothetical protein ASPCADRAFT_401265 [Aspergillus carbonarius ITEM 5010]
MLDSLVRVSRRVVYNHYASVRAEARHYIPGAFDRPPKPTLARPRGSTPARMPAEPRGRVWLQALPFHISRAV